MLWLVSFAFSKQEDEEEEDGKFEKIMFTCILDLMIFSSIFLHAVTFSHVLHLDVLKSQKLKVKTEISLCMAIMQNNPLPSLYTQYYRTV